MLHMKPHNHAIENADGICTWYYHSVPPFNLKLHNEFVSHMFVCAVLMINKWQSCMRLIRMHFATRSLRTPVSLYIGSNAALALDLSVYFKSLIIHEHLCIINDLC